MGKNTKNLVLASLLLTIVIVIQLMGRFNPDLSRIVVGPVINAILLLTVYFCGRRFGIIMACLTPLMALVTGQLNPLLAPFIPFIMLGNLALVVPFMLLLTSPIKRVIGLGIGSILKYLVMNYAATNAVTLFCLNIPANVVNALPVAFGLVQLGAALAGGALALILIETLKTSWHRS